MSTPSATGPDEPDRPPAAGFDVAQWVAASCARQGVAAKVTDARVVARVAVLFSGRRAGSEPPDGLDPGRVKAASAADPGTDHRVVEHGCDDGVSPVEAEFGPLAS